MRQIARPLLVVILGPTAVGKTRIAINLAQRLEAPILSADSRQIYRELNIGVARPSQRELAAAEHLFIATRTVHERFSCGQYELDALEALENSFQKIPYALLVGGSMLYIDAVCCGIDEFPVPDPALRAQLTERLRKEGVKPLYTELQRVDPLTAQRIDPSNGARVLRALEVTLQTGKPYSQWRTNGCKPRDFGILKIGLKRPLEELELRIEKRLEGMMQEGLLEEAKALFPYRHLPALRTVGYSELFQYLEGKCALEEAKKRIQVNTRRYAKRQITWWKRDKEIAWFHPDEEEEIRVYIQKNASPLVNS